MSVCGSAFTLTITLGIADPDLRVAASDSNRANNGLSGSASLLLVVRPGAPSSVLAPSSDALCSERSVRSLLSGEFPKSPMLERTDEPRAEPRAEPGIRFRTLAAKPN